MKKFSHFNFLSYITQSKTHKLKIWVLDTIFPTQGTRNSWNEKKINKNKNRVGTKIIFQQEELTI